LVLSEALNVSGVDTESASIGDLTCSERRLAPRRHRRLDDVSFTLLFVASFMDVGDADSFASSVNTASEDLEASFETLAASTLGVNVSVVVESVTVDDNDSESGAFQTSALFGASVATMVFLFSFGHW